MLIRKGYPIMYIDRSANTDERHNKDVSMLLNGPNPAKRWTGSDNVCLKNPRARIHGRQRQCNGATIFVSSTVLCTLYLGLL